MENTKENKRDLIFQKIISCFRLRGFGPTDNFDSKIWFLKDDPYFNSITNPNYNPKTKGSTPQAPNKMFEIINSCNLNQSDKTLRKMSVNVKSFINSICDFIVESYKMINLSESSIEKNNAHKRINVINETITILKNRIGKKSAGDFKSQLQVTVMSFNNIPPGKYRMSLLINREVEDNESDSKKSEVSLLSPKSLHSLFVEKEIHCSNQITVDSWSNRSMLNSINHVFPDYDFVSLDINSNKFVFERCFSGTSFSNFKLLLKNEGSLIESKNNYLLDLLISYVDDLCDISQTTFGKRLNIKLKENVDASVLLEFSLKLDDLTRCAVLYRISEILSIPVEKKRLYENGIDEILDSYFPDLAESIKKIMTTESEEKRNACCQCSLQ